MEGPLHAVVAVCACAARKLFEMVLKWNRHSYINNFSLLHSKLKVQYSWEPNLLLSAWALCYLLHENHLKNLATTLYHKIYTIWFASLTEIFGHFIENWRLGSIIGSIIFSILKNQLTCMLRKSWVSSSVRVAVSEAPRLVRADS